MQSRSLFLSSLAGTLVVTGCSGGSVALPPRRSTSSRVTLGLAESITLAKAGVTGYSRKGQLYVLHPKAPQVYSATRAPRKNSLLDAAEIVSTDDGGVGSWSYDAASNTYLRVIGAVVAYRSFPTTDGGGGYQSSYNGGGIRGICWRSGCTRRHVLHSRSAASSE